MTKPSTKTRLTEKRIRDAMPDATKITFIWDAGFPGFGVRLSKTGVRAFVLWVRHGDRKNLLTLGRWPTLSLEGARAAAALELGHVEAGGVDLLTRRAERRDAPTVEDGCRWFLETHVPRRRGLGKMAERTELEYRRQINAYIIPEIGHLKIEAVTRQHIEAALDKIGWSKPTQFARVRSLIRSLFNLFEIEGWRTEGTNPGRRIATPTERERTRVLTPGEQNAFLVALGRLGNNSATLAIKFLYETGARFNEVRTMRWDFVDHDTATVVLPETKTGPKVIRATGEAMAVLANCKKVAGNDFVFFGAGSAPLAEKTIRRVFKQAARMAMLADVKPHDLRRSFITDAIGASVPITTVADLVGHASIHMTAKYAKAADGQVREAGEHLAAARRAKRDPGPVGPTDGAKVVSIENARRSA